VAGGDDAHAAAGGIVRIDREAGLDVGGAEVAIGRFGQAEARILMPGEVPPAAGRLPVELVDDLLQVAPEQRLQHARQAAVEPDGIEHRLVPGHPLDHPHLRRPVILRRDIVEQIAVAEAAAMGDALFMDLIDGRADRRNFGRREQVTDDGVTVAGIIGDISGRLIRHGGRATASPSAPGRS
jgi:hypothetical protein